ncbi:MAG: hypothetical protein WC694_01605 [Candidatus Paceibacterota bacterium]|jgi:hypothetical protein
MNSETKICQNCKQDFIIEPEDFNFYEKIKVLPPTFCPECRTIRRLTWRNEMSLFKRKCDAPGHNEMLISFLPPEEKLTVYCSDAWWGDGWDPLSYGKEYDFLNPFFEQWKNLRDNIPLQSLSNIKDTNSDYCNVAEASKDSYMCSGSWRIERTLYANRITGTKDSADLYVVNRSELCYEDVLCSDSYHLLYSLNCKSCVDSYFLYDCVGCTDCFGCTNLRNKSYCMWNEQFSREEYHKKIAEYSFKDYRTIQELKNKFREICLKSLHRFAVKIKTVDSTGDNLEGTKNCKICFDATGDIEDAKFSHWAVKSLKDAYDSGPGVGEGEMLYEVFDTGIGGSRNLFGSVIYGSNDIEYSFNCHGSSNLFGCIGVRNKKYCILNKQYSKEEYEKLIPKIEQQMNEVPYVDKRGIVYKYGEFFPSELSTFCYNETQAQDYFPLSKEQAIKMGYRWREKKVNEYQTTIEAKDLPSSLDDVTDSITKEIIGCDNKEKSSNCCRGAYKITIDELNLYRKLGVPLPRLCFLCRHENRLKMRNPMKIWHRSCMCDKENHFHGNEKCEVEFETSYAPDRPEIVYCEKCYQQEVY